VFRGERLACSRELDEKIGPVSLPVSERLCSFFSSLPNPIVVGDESVRTEFSHQRVRILEPDVQGVTASRAHDFECALSLPSR